MKNQRIKTGKLQMKAILLTGVLVFESIFAGIGTVNAQTVSENGITAEESTSLDVSVSENAPEQEVIPDTKMSGPQEEDVAAEKAAIKYSGRDGEVNWSIDVNGHLTLTGNGDYIGNNVREPKWLEYSSEIISAEVAVTNMTSTHNMFNGCNNMSSLNLNDFNTSKVTDMSDMFKSCSGLTSLDLSGFNTSNVTDMNAMFYNCSGLTNLTLGDNFSTGKVTDMSGMFGRCSGLESLALGDNFSTDKVTDMSYMFGYCSRLKELNLSRFDTGSVISMESMFIDCHSLTILDVGNFITSNVTYMSKMFYNCKNLISLDVSRFDTSNVTSMSDMFYGCSNLTSLEVSTFNTGKVTNMSRMFYCCESLWILDVSNFDTSKVTNMSNMFYGCSDLTSLNLSSFETSKVTDMSGMFNRCFDLKILTFGADFCTANVTNMNSMFRNCAILKTLDVSNFDTSNVTDMQTMFYGMSVLDYLNLSTWNLSSLMYADEMLESSNVVILELPNLPLDIELDAEYLDETDHLTDVAKANMGEMIYRRKDYAESDCGKKGHNYNTPLFVWSADYTEVNVHFICTRADCFYNTKKTLPAVITSQTVSPTIEKEGATIYTATVVFGGETYIDVRSVAIPKLPTPEPSAKPTAQPVGTSLNMSGIFYRVIETGETPELAYMGPKNKKVKTVTIPAIVKVDGITYKVTSVADVALKNCKKLTKVTVGANVTKIGKNAFYGCKKLKTVVIKTKKLKSIGKNALKGINKRAKIDVPNSKKKAYKKLLKSKTGYKKTMSVK